MYVVFYHRCYYFSLKKCFASICQNLYHGIFQEIVVATQYGGHIFHYICILPCLNKYLLFYLAYFKYCIVNCILNVIVFSKISKCPFCTLHVELIHAIDQITFQNRYKSERHSHCFKN